MRRKDDIALEKAVAHKRIRNRVRLELAVVGDKLLNDMIADFDEGFDRAVANGEPYQLVDYDRWVMQQVYNRLIDAADEGLETLPLEVGV